MHRTALSLLFPPILDRGAMKKSNKNKLSQPGKAENRPVTCRLSFALFQPGDLLLQPLQPFFHLLLLAGLRLPPARLSPHSRGPGNNRARGARNGPTFRAAPGRRCRSPSCCHNSSASLKQLFLFQQEGEAPRRQDRHLGAGADLAGDLVEPLGLLQQPGPLAEPAQAEDLAAVAGQGIIVQVAARPAARRRPARPGPWRCARRPARSARRPGCAGS